MPAAHLSEQRRKELGAFYTPVELAECLVNWCLRSASDSAIDPSYGGYVFLEQACRRLEALGAEPRSVGRQVCGIDVDEEAAHLTQQRPDISDCRLIRADFFEIEPSPKMRFTANIGNPPYIRYQEWNGSSARARTVAEGLGVTLTRLASAWAPFIVHGCQFLEPGGRMGQVLPAEFLHAQYARSVAEYLTESFERVTLVLFDEQVFPGAQEEVLLLFAEGYGAGPAAGIGVMRCRNTEDLDTDRIDGKGRGYVDLDTPLLRLLPVRTQRTYQRLATSSSVTTLGDLAAVDIGVVTGANGFFVRCRDEIDKRGFDPTLFATTVSKAKHVAGARFSSSDVATLEKAGHATAMLVADRSSDEALGTVAALIREGERDGLHERYKCRIRDPWYAVPIPKRGVGDAFLTYMSNGFPRLVLNEVGALSTNTVHSVSLHSAAAPDALAAVFYNSLTLLSAELVGRSYGGGILKLEPTEAERLLIPRFDGRLGKALPAVDRAVRVGDLDAALDLVDRQVLPPLGLDDGAIRGLRRAREYLVARRRGRSGKHRGTAGRQGRNGR